MQQKISFVAFTTKGVTEAGFFELQGNLIIDDKKAFITGTLQKLFKAHDFYPEIYREVIVMSYTDDDIRATYEQYCKDVIVNIRAMIKVINCESRVKDEEMAVIIICSMLESIIHRTRFLISEIDDNRYINELTDILYRYLFD